MCGITGMVGRVDRALLERMTGTLAHRGPDGDGIRVGDGWGFGHRRLSIIDLAGGAQPMARADGRTWITFNGEIYNFIELRAQLERLGHRFRTSSDTEVLLEAYAEWGDAMVEHLVGMFAFAIRDEDRDRVLVVRDHVGVKPLYWTEVAGSLLFASEPKALLEHPGVSRECDPVALDAYLDLFYVPPPLSIFAGLRQLPPGHLLVHERGTTTVRAWWDALPAVVPGRSLEEWGEIAAPVLEDAIVLQTRSDVPFGAFLSGGLDSSTIVGVLAEHSDRPIETFCVGYGEEGKTFDERAMARTVAEFYGTRHHEVVIDIDVLGGIDDVARGFDEPFGSPTALLSSALSKFTRGFVKVALAGDGGDELFGGYPRYRGLMLAERAELLPRGLVDLAARAFEGREAAVARSYRRWGRQFLAGLRMPTAQRYAAWVGYTGPEERDRLLDRSMREAVRERGRVEPVAEWFARPVGCDAVERAAYADLHGFLPENVLRCSDRMSMAHGLELRVPLCDHRLVELAMQVPSRRRLGVIASKRVLRRVGRHRLPRAIMRRRKLGFNAPLGVWMRRDLARIVRQWLAPEVVRRRALLDPTEVTRLVEEHRDGRRDHGPKLWALIMIEAWARTRLDSPAAPR